MESIENWIGPLSAALPDVSPPEKQPRLPMCPSLFKYTVKYCSGARHDMALKQARLHLGLRAGFSLEEKKIYILNRVSFLKHRSCQADGGLAAWLVLTR